MAEKYLTPRRAIGAMMVALTIAGFALTLSPARAAIDPIATRIREFVGGVRPAAKLADPAIIFRLSSACFDRFPFARYQSAAPAERCMIKGLKRAGASRQAIAFARFAPVPAAIASIRRYRVAAAVYADMRWADGAGGWCLIGRAGDAVPMWGPVDLSRDRRFAAFAGKHPGVIPWMPDGPDQAPRVAPIAGGGERFIFNFVLKTCRACARDGTAAIAFEFSKTGKFAGFGLSGIQPANPAR